jgi:hypothetical protein
VPRGLRVLNQINIGNTLKLEIKATKVRKEAIKEAKEARQVEKVKRAPTTRKVYLLWATPRMAVGSALPTIPKVAKIASAVMCMFAVSKVARKSTQWCSTQTEGKTKIQALMRGAQKSLKREFNARNFLFLGYFTSFLEFVEGLICMNA